MDTQEKQYTAIAKLNAQGEPVLGDAQVIVGDGSVKVMFKNGRAQVSAFEADLLQHRGDIEVPGYVPQNVVAEPAPMPAPVQAGGLPPGAVINGDGTITLSADSLTPEQREAVRQALEIAPVEHETVKPAPGDEAALQAAQEYLAEEGMAVEQDPEQPQPTVVPAEPVAKTFIMPEGFQATTAEGEPRCMARKADGSQCSNAAKGDSHACGLKKHQDQLAD